MHAKTNFGLHKNFVILQYKKENMKEIKLKFKDGVFGFVYDAVYGDVSEIVKRPLSKETIEFFNNNTEDQVLFTTTDELAELFGIESEAYVTEYWGDILETVK